MLSDSEMSTVPIQKVLILIGFVKHFLLVALFRFIYRVWKYYNKPCYNCQVCTQNYRILFRSFVRVRLLVLLIVAKKENKFWQSNELT